jgi:hypothetical protein
VNYINAKVLAGQLRSESYNDKDVLNFFIAGALITVLREQWLISVSEGSQWGVNLLLQIMVCVGVTVFGFKWVHKAHQVDDNKAFVVRLIFLSVPVSIQIVVLQCTAYVLYILFKYVLKFGDIFTYIYILSSYLILLYYFYSLRRYIKIVSSP